MFPSDTGRCLCLSTISFELRLVSAPQLTLIWNKIATFSGMNGSHSFIRDQCDRKSVILIRKEEELSFVCALLKDLGTWTHYLKHVERLVDYCTPLSRCQFLKNQPRRRLCQFQHLSSPSQQENSPITSCDTVWRRCFMGCRRRCLASLQRSSASVCTSLYMSRTSVCNEWIRGRAQNDPVHFYRIFLAVPVVGYVLSVQHHGADVTKTTWIQANISPMWCK